ncbi:hypothetical protein XENTR_v10013411 [Xenopus tropicalis]|nr:hypothetical protein XENTR_v10013411 [Xenopus tropicalis]KAE8600792.1 hypothetical protein XENTR_v10013411 [Xenopus tropicalis]KAE8600793.1 hypothetical protein XENTR_v10013411 [Xenopus tropicalis]
MDDLDKAIEAENTRNIITISIILIVGFLIVSGAVIYLIILFKKLGQNSETKRTSDTFYMVFGNYGSRGGS